RSLCTNLAEIDVETPATMKYDLEKSKDETRYDLKHHKPITELQGRGQSTMLPKSTSGAAATQPRAESAETSSVVPQSSQYVLTPTNFAKMVCKADKHEKQLKLFAEQLGTFVDKAITTALESYASLHAHIDDMEAQATENILNN
ncbi:hypothetical protein HAX54_009655, partial [Datura stramonium]|nr:hypothetical protein [Datura stramonium]